MVGRANVSSLAARLVQRITPSSEARLDHQVPLGRDPFQSRKLAASGKPKILCRFTCRAAHGIVSLAIHALVGFQSETIGSVD